MRVRRSGEVRVSLPPDRAIRVFTAEGEREWAPGWAPSYPDGDADAPGTVFTTDAHDVHTTWIILERTPLTAVYARLTPGVSAGTVTVVLRPDGEATVAEVTYDLTALGDDADLERFAEGFDGMMAAWERLIGDAAGRF
jgi:hypothetical protein